MRRKVTEEDHADDYTTFKAYSASDSYDDIVAGKNSAVEAFSKHEATTCEICGLTARTDGELADHIRHAHGMQ